MASMLTDTQTSLFPLIQIKGMLKLHIVSGGKLRHSRISPTALLKAASSLTGVTYKRGQYAQALADIEAILASV